MTSHCPSPLARSMYADGELAAADAAALDAHLECCAACRARIGALRMERSALCAALAGAEPLEAPVPRFEPALGARSLALLGVGVLAVALLAASAWSALADAVPAELRWLNPFGPGALLSLLMSFALLLTNEGFAMLTSTAELAASAVLLALLAYASAVLLKPRTGTAVLLSVLLLVAALPLPSHAFEVRKSDGSTTVAAGETIDDTLLAIGQTVSIDGDVNGDLLALARVVTIRGHVAGDVLVGGETVDIQGNVGGSLYAAGRGVTIKQMRVGRNLYTAGGNVTVDSSVEIGGNATAAGDNMSIDGKVGIDLTTAGNALVVRGEVARNVNAFGQTITLLAPASVGGNLVAHVRAADNFQIAPGATVRGNVDKQVSTERGKPVSRYLTTSFYTWQIVRLGAAYLAGLLLLAAFAGLRTASVADAGAGLKAGAIGLVTAIALPVLAFIACITIVGIPLGIFAAILWLLGLYFAKIVVAQMIGRRLFMSPQGVPHYAATLLAGLVIVIIAINLPWVGWLVGVALTLLGLGMIVTYAAERSGRTL